MSIHKVDRKVDTVIIELDISTAEKLAEVLANVLDKTRIATTPRFDLGHLLYELEDKADVRWPSPLYEAIFTKENPEAVTLVDRKFA